MNFESPARDFKTDIGMVGRIEAVPKILEVVCRATGMGFAAVARVTEERWVACAVLDEIGFGLKPGGELKVETTICHEIRQSREPVVINHVDESTLYCHHPTPAIYGFQSYISMPIILANGSFFGTLCSIDPRPAMLDTPATIGMFRLFADLIAKHLEDQRKSAATELLSRVISAQRRTADPETIMQATAEAVGKFLDADAAGFFEIGNSQLEFYAGWAAGRLPLLTGNLSSTAMGTGVLQEIRAGKTVEISDVRSNPLTRDFPFEPAAAVSLLSVPIIREGLCRAGFYLNQAAPRIWTSDEIQLASDFGEQTWDAVERARTGAARTAAEERLNLAMDAGGGIGAWDWNIPSDLVFCNPRFAQLFSLDPSCAETGLPLAQFVANIHQDDRPSVSRKIAEAVRSGGQYAEEFRVVQNGGAICWVYARGRCHLNAQGEPSRFPGVVFDITERREQQYKMLETAKLESLGVLAGGVAHDFNNLLTGIMGNASLLEDVVADQHRPFAQQIVSASKRAAHLTRQMLAYSGKGRFELSNVSLSQQVREILPLIKTSLEGAAINLSLDDNVPSIKADPGQLQQIVMNLAINAAEAIEGPGGTVTISTGVTVIDQAYIEQVLANQPLLPGPYVWLEVQDTGVGMSKETQAKIFDPFFTTKFTGRGLGLAAVSGIVRGHRGAIQIYSALGHGATFKVLFPAAASGMLSLAVKDAVQNAAVKATILFVDDEDVVRAIGQNILAINGYAVRLACNGREAVDKLKSSPRDISLIVLDMTMPVMSGEEAFGHLREIRPDVPILVSSGYNEVEVIRRFTAGNIAGFIQKPYTAGQLLEKINKTLG